MTPPPNSASHPPARARQGSAAVNSPPVKHLYLKRPRCPSCDSANLRTQGSREDGLGIRVANMRCRACLYTFVAVWE